MTGIRQRAAVRNKRNIQQQQGVYLLDITAPECQS